MPGEPAPRSTTHGLLFLMFLSFIASFLIARVFSTLNPTVVVVAGDIHFHHFWYGLAMIFAAGGLGIIHNDPRYRRLYAVIFGLGGGLVGDEVGLLLTFGNYDSALTLYFFVIAVSLGVLGILLGGYKKELEYDVLSLGSGERLAYLGVVVAGVSAIPFAAGGLLVGAAILVAGAVVLSAGLSLHRRKAT